MVSPYEAMLSIEFYDGGFYNKFERLDEYLTQLGFLRCY